MFVCCVRCVLSGRGLCDELITHPEESYRLWRVVVWDQETSCTRSSWPALDCRSRDDDDDDDDNNNNNIMVVRELGVQDSSVGAGAHYGLQGSGL
jgi:hypothetical protein